MRKKLFFDPVLLTFGAGDGDDNIFDGNDETDKDNGDGSGEGDF